MKIGNASMKRATNTLTIKSFELVAPLLTRVTDFYLL